VRRVGNECAYIAEDAIEPPWEGQKFSLAQCVSGRVMKNGEPAMSALRSLRPSYKASV
jgi:hypothetical protein